MKGETNTKLRSMTELCAYYYNRYHVTRRALIACRLDKLSLESMVDALQKQLGDKDPDITLGDDLDVK